MTKDKEAEIEKSKSMTQEAMDTLRDIINNPGDDKLLQDLASLYSLMMPNMDSEMQLSFKKYQTAYFDNPSYENLMSYKFQVISLAGLFLYSIGHTIEHRLDPWVFFSEMMEEIKEWKKISGENGQQRQGL